MRLVFLLLLSFLYLQAFSDPDPLIYFIENKKQWPREYAFGTNIPNGRMLFAGDRIRFWLYDKAISTSEKADAHSTHDQPWNESGIKTTSLNIHVYDIQFLNSNPAVAIKGHFPAETKFNYLLGNDSTQWASNARSFYGVFYQDIYCGIDMRYYSAKGRLKFDWIVKPQVDPSAIALQYNGVDQVDIVNGNLKVTTSVAEVWEMQPYAYQLINGKKMQVPCRYRLENKVVKYVFPEGYDECEELIIDPILIFSGYSGSTLDNWGNTATYDESGNVYSGGMVANPGRLAGFPVTPGAYQMQSAGGAWDVGILKYDSSGSKLLYCTYLGGNNAETPQSLVVNHAGELLILGVTSSSNFPVTNGSVFSGGVAIDPLNGVDFNFGTDLFIAKLSADGSQLKVATFLGGTQNDGVNFVSGDMGFSSKVESPLGKNYGDQLRGDIITDKNDFVYIASNTRSADFPIVNTGTAFAGGTHDAIVVKLHPDLSSIVWSRYIGGNGTDAAYSIRFDQQENVFVAGGSNSIVMGGMDGLRTQTHGGIDGWVQSLDQNGFPIHGTYLGTTAYDQVYFIDLNEQNEVFVFGQTQGAYPVSSNVYSNAGSGQFIHKLSHDLKTSVFSTVVGSGSINNVINPNISPTAFLISECGYIYLSGWGGVTNQTTINNNPPITRNYVGGNTRNMPITADAYQKTTNGNDFYFMVLSADASEFLYGTYLGGTQSATHVDGGTSRFDKRGIVYHAVCAGCGGRSDFPAVNVPQAHQTNRSINCNNAVFKFDLTLLKARLQSNSVELNNPGLNKVCIPDKIVFQNKSNGGKIFHWDMGDGTRLTKPDTSHILHEYKQPGRYRVKLKAIDPGTCQVQDSAFLFIDVFLAEAFVQDDDDMCLGSSYQLKASGGASYLWTTEDGMLVASIAMPTVSPKDTTVYYIYVTENNGCVHKDTVQLNVIPTIKPDFEIERLADCFSTPGVRVRNLTDSIKSGDRLFFDFGDGTQADLEEVNHQFQADGVYHVKLVGIREFCVTEKVVSMPFMRLAVPNIITPAIMDGKNDYFKVAMGADKEAVPQDFGYDVSVIIYNRWGKKVYEEKNYNHDWKADNLPAGIYYYELTVAGHATCKSWVHVVK